MNRPVARHAGGAVTSTLDVVSRTEGRWKAREVWCAVAGVVSLALAVGAASTVAVPVESDLGLVAVLPFPFWVGVLLLNVAFVVALRGDVAGPARRVVMVWLVVVLVLVLFGTAAFVTDVPRGEVAFRHLGVADALSGAGGIDAGIDAYFNWPGFFALLATVLGATGLDPVAVALWAPVFNVGLWLVALGVLTGYLTRDPRRRWLVLWVFCLGSWQDQDYLSPQAFGFFLYLVVIAMLVGPLAARAPGSPGSVASGVRIWWRGGGGGAGRVPAGAAGGCACGDVVARRGHLRESSADAVHGAHRDYRSDAERASLAQPAAVDRRGFADALARLPGECISHREPAAGGSGVVGRDRGERP